MKVAFVTAATNYQVTVRAGGSHLLFQAEEVMIAEADTTPNISYIRRFSYCRGKTFSNN